MIASTGSVRRSRPLKMGRVFILLIGVVCVGFLVTLVARITTQFTTTPLPHRLIFEEDIPLPGAMPDAFRTAKNPLAPGLSVFFDHFDFQVVDPQMHLLFIVHTGPSPDRVHQLNPNFNPDTDAKTDGNIVVFDTLHKKVIGLLNIPQATGIVLAPDLHKAYAADGNDNIVYVIDEKTFHYSPIPLQPNDSPDGLAYDQKDHLIYVSNPGAPSHPDVSNVIDQKNQNETVVDALTDKVIAVIPLGIDGKWGDDIGHVRYDPMLHRMYVVVEQLPNPDDPNPNLLPPPGKAFLVAIDPVAHKVLMRMVLPEYCFVPHGVAIDTAQHIAFIACVDADPPSLYRVDLRKMQLFSEPGWPLPVKPDIIALDTSLHLVYVACGAGLAVFQENGRALKWLGSYTYGVNTHTVAVNEETHEIYLPLVRVGGRPVLRIMRYNPEGVV
jgi:hypothetical protein